MSMAIKHKDLDYILFCNADFIIHKIQKLKSREFISILVNLIWRKQRRRRKIGIICCLNGSGTDSGFCEGNVL